jgi:hypothetical protein
LFVAYRNVLVKTEGSDTNAEEAKFISSEYARIKFKNKKSPRNYSVEKDVDGNLKVVKYNGKGSTLQELYESLAGDNSTVYTDSYSKTFTIRLGQPVTVDRSKCDPNQNRTCSRGLHVAGLDRLSRNYFGNTSLQVLVNPADVVAVPPQDNYGKMRTCAYYPVQVVEFGEDGKIIDPEIEDGFEDDFINIISYKGEVNNKDDSNYQLEIPSIPELNRAQIMTRLDQIRDKIYFKVEDHYSDEEEDYDDDDEYEEEDYDDEYEEDYY